MRAHFPSEGSALERYCRALRRRSRSTPPSTARIAPGPGRAGPQACPSASASRSSSRRRSGMSASWPIAGSRSTAFWVRSARPRRQARDPARAAAAQARLRTRAGRRAFSRSLAGALRRRIACEPRHPSWFEPAADGFCDSLRSPASPPTPLSCRPPPPRAAGDGFVYCRLHGSPRMYRSAYDAEQPRRLMRGRSAPSPRRAAKPGACSTTPPPRAATGDALSLMAKLRNFRSG